MHLTKKVSIFLAIGLIASAFIILTPQITGTNLDPKVKELPENFYLFHRENINRDTSSIHLDALEEETPIIKLVTGENPILIFLKEFFEMLVEPLRKIPIIEKLFIAPLLFLFNILILIASFLFNILILIARRFFWDPIITPLFIASISTWSWLVSLVHVHILRIPVELHLKGGSKKNLKLLSNELTEGYRIYIGFLEIPEQIYKDDSYSISAKFARKYILSSGDNTLQQNEAYNPRITSKAEEKIMIEKVELDNLSNYNLELGVSASGFTITDEKKQAQALESNNLSFYWNCYFPNSGSQEVRLLLKATSQSRENVIRDIKHRVKVVVLGGLTHSQVSSFSTLGGVATFIIAVLAFLKK